jgi:hypothetical protein
METITETATKLLNTMMKHKHLVAYYIGIFFVIVSHLMMLRTPNMYWHSIFNLIAAALIAYYFMNKEFGYGSGDYKSAEVQEPVVTTPPVVEPTAPVEQTQLDVTTPPVVEQTAPVEQTQLDVTTPPFVEPTAGLS